MSSLNKAILIGRVGKDPELRQTSGGEAIVNMTLATSERWKDKTSGEMKEQTEWHRLTLFGRQAEIAAQYAKKGAMICVEGQLKTRKWTDQQGIERYTTEIQVRDLKLLVKPADGGGQAAPAPQQRAAAPSPRQRPAQGGFDDMDDDIPF